MTVHSESRRQFKDHNCPTTVPDGMLNEAMANRNHGQTLHRLNERGGMGIREMVANIKHESVVHNDTLEDLIELKKLIEQYTQEQPNN